MVHEVHRIRHEARRRAVVVRKAQWLTPQMRRIRFGGDDLAGFTSLSPDDHVKVIVPDGGGDTARRDYTPRRFDADKQELEIDFALHADGPVTVWARAAKVGETIEIGGPRGSAVLPYDFDWWILIGDETALPAIGRRLEEMPRGARVTTIAAVTDEAEQQSFSTQTSHTAIWVHRPYDKAVDSEPIIEAIRDLKRPPGDGFIWIAAEAGVARKLRQHVVDVMGQPLQWLKASGYWVKGQADASDKSIA
jgi:NADPH-dependent ferric siderophore reductase